jgi:hypothetical protein
MRKLAEEWVDQLGTGKLSLPEAWLAVRMTIWKTLEYPLNKLTLSKAECDYIMAPPIKSGLVHGAGICQNLPKALQHGPISHQGLKLPHIYTLQGIARLTKLLNHNHLKMITGFLHQAHLEQANDCEHGIRHPYTEILPQEVRQTCNIQAYKKKLEIPKRLTHDTPS